MSAEIGTKPTLTIGRRRVLHNVPVTFPAFDVAPDDQRTLRFWPVTGGDSAQSTLVLVQNFLAELRARR